MEFWSMFCYFMIWNSIKKNLINMYSKIIISSKVFRRNRVIPPKIIAIKLKFYKSVTLFENIYLEFYFSSKHNFPRNPWMIILQLDSIYFIWVLYHLYHNHTIISSIELYLQPFWLKINKFCIVDQVHRWVRYVFWY